AGIKNLLWNYDPVPDPESRIQDEPNIMQILKEINGWYTDTGEHLASFGDLKDDGSTTCASWIYCGVYPDPETNRAAMREPDPEGVVGANLNWGFAWPAKIGRAHV